MWVGALTKKAYRNHKKRADDIVKILCEKLIDLKNAGCEFVQFDEPVLTEVVMSEECDRRTFMLATLATRRDAGKELKFAADLINRVVKGIGGIRIGVHICLGNWSRQEEVLLSSDYTRRLPALERMKIDQFVLEYATPRAGDIAVVGKHLSDSELALAWSIPGQAMWNP